MVARIRYEITPMFRFRYYCRGGSRTAPEINNNPMQASSIEPRNLYLITIDITVGLPNSKFIAFEKTKALPAALRLPF